MNSQVNFETKTHFWIWGCWPELSGEAKQWLKLWEKLARYLHEGGQPWVRWKAGPRLRGRRNRVKTREGTSETCGCRHTMVTSSRLARGWLRRKRGAPTGNSKFGGADGGNWRGCSSPIMSILSQALQVITYKRQSSTKDRARTARSDGQAYLSVFVFSACHDLPMDFPLGIGFLATRGSKVFFPYYLNI